MSFGFGKMHVLPQVHYLCQAKGMGILNSFQALDPCVCSLLGDLARIIGIHIMFNYIIFNFLKLKEDYDYVLY